MTEEDLKAGLSRFRDIQEAPSLRARVKELEAMLAEKDRQVEKINNMHEQKLAALQNSIHRQEGRVRELEAGVRELESIKVQVGKDKLTLREFKQRAKAQVKKEMQEEVVIRANALAEIKIPLFVKSEILKYPDHCMNETRSHIESRARVLRDEYLNNESTWSPEFRSQINKHIDTKVDEKKTQSFWEEVHKEADNEINQLLPNAWAWFLSNYATNFLQNTLQNQLRQLSASLTLNCPVCGRPHQVTLTPNDLSTLIRSGRISFKCVYCRGWFKPNITITLGELFWLIQKGDLIPERILIGRPV